MLWNEDEEIQDGGFKWIFFLVSVLSHFRSLWKLDSLFDCDLHVSKEHENTIVWNIEKKLRLNESG